MPFNIINLFAIVPPFKELFLCWATLDDYNRNHLKCLVEQNQNIDIKSMVVALEEWDHLQNYGR